MRQRNHRPIEQVELEFALPFERVFRRRCRTVGETGLFRPLDQIRLVRPCGKS